MRILKFLAGVLGVLLALFAVGMGWFGHREAAILDAVLPGRAAEVEIGSIEPDPSQRDMMIVGVVMPGVGSVGSISLLRRDAEGLSPGQAVTVHPTSRGDIPFVTDPYLQKRLPVWQIAGRRFSAPALIAAIVIGIVAALLLFLAFRRGRRRAEQPAKRTAPVGAPARKPEPFAAPLSVDAALGDRQYRLRVVILALTGQGIIFGTLGLYVLALAGAVTILARVPAFLAFLKFALIPLVAATWSVVQAMRVKLPPPDGLDISAADAPALFAMVDSLTRAAGAPRPGRIAIDRTCNAGITQVPRLGLLGWYRNHLVIGLPLLQALSVEQVKAVLAHELAHLRRGHGRIGNWIYRIRTTWLQLADRMQASGNAFLAPFRLVFRWYMPRFHAYSFAHARAQEFEADRFAAGLTSRQAMAGALVAVAVSGRLLVEDFWPGIFKQADRRPDPDLPPFRDMAAYFARPPEATQVSRFIDERLAAPPGVHDTHPTLGDRLAALGETAALPERTGPSAAEALLGPCLERIARQFDRDWRNEVGPWWKERHGEVAAAESRLGDLAALESDRPLTPAELADFALLTEARRDRRDAIPRFRAWAAAEPESAAALFGLGRVLLEDDPATAIDLLERAMRAELTFTPNACRLIARHLSETGGSQAAIQDYVDRADEADHLLEVANAERRFLPGDTLERHGLDDAEAEAIREHLKAFPFVRRVWLSRKVLRHLPDRAPYFVGLADIPFFTRDRQGKLQAVAKDLPTPGGAILYLRDGWTPAEIRRIPKIEGSLIYSRDQGSSSVSQ